MTGRSDPRDLLVETEYGTVQGVVADGVRTWRAIPYAAPPVGVLRFQAPRPATPWSGIRDAAEFGPIPMQKRGFEHVAGAGKTTPISEDCLTINVSAPLSPPAGLRPVVVWIYGGAFLFGGSRGPLYRGDRLVKNGNVIFVSFNYRTGAFGFSDFREWSTPLPLIRSGLVPETRWSERAARPLSNLAAVSPSSPAGDRNKRSGKY
jgi:para-nitrobenzyl esterase